MEEIRAFLARLFAPGPRRPLIGDGGPPGRELGGAWRQAVEYRLAELGCDLRPEIMLRSVPADPRETPGRLVFQDEALYIEAGAVQQKRLRPAALALDLPYALIDRPAVRRGDTPEAKIAGRLAAAMLTPRRILDPRELVPVDVAHGAVLGQPPEALLTWIASSVMPIAHPEVRELLRSRGREVVATAQGLIEGAWQCRTQGTGPDGAPLPVIPVHRRPGAEDPRVLLRRPTGDLIQRGV